MSNAKTVFWLSWSFFLPIIHSFMPINIVPCSFPSFFLWVYVCADIARCCHAFMCVCACVCHGSVCASVCHAPTCCFLRRDMFNTIKLYCVFGNVVHVDIVSVHDCAYVCLRISHWYSYRALGWGDVPTNATNKTTKDLLVDKTSQWNHCRTTVGLQL